jgi:hypothetical protein
MCRVHRRSFGVQAQNANDCPTASDIESWLFAGRKLFHQESRCIVSDEADWAGDDQAAAVVGKRSGQSATPRLRRYRLCQAHEPPWLVTGPGTSALSWRHPAVDLWTFPIS